MVKWASLTVEERVVYVICGVVTVLWVLSAAFAVFN